MFEDVEADTGMLTEPTSTKQPFLIVVTGLPGTGKTTLGRRMAEELRVPFLYKDGIKETLFDALGTGSIEWSQRLGAATYDLFYYFLESIMTGGVSLLIESNFEAVRAEPHLRDLLKRYSYYDLQVLCKAEGPVLVERFEERAKSAERHQGHVDNLDELRPKLMRGRIGPINLPGPLLEVDTTDLDTVDYRAILFSVRAMLAVASK